MSIKLAFKQKSQYLNVRILMYDITLKSFTFNHFLSIIKTNLVCLFF